MQYSKVYVQVTPLVMDRNTKTSKSALSFTSPAYFQSLSGPLRWWDRGVITPGPATFKGPRCRLEIQSTPDYTIKKIQKFSPQRGPARVFSLALLWLSTGLIRVIE